MHLLCVEFIKEYRCFKPMKPIKLEPVTVIVGEQGTGKSTLLKLLSKPENDVIKIELSEYLQTNSIDFFYFDSESMNPRIQDLSKFSDANGRSVGIGVGGALASHFKSHGEILREYTVKRIPEAENCILLLDEPESALSPSNQYRLAREIVKCPERNVQIILATHCIPIIENVEMVLDISKKKWVSSKKFLNTVRK